MEWWCVVEFGVLWWWYGVWCSVVVWGGMRKEKRIRFFFP